MRALALPVLLGVMLFPSTTRAEFYLGVMGISGLNGIAAEWADTWGSVWLLAGAYQAASGFELDNATGLAGYRRFQNGGFNRSGFFGGALVGDVDGGTEDNNFGAGGEVGYQWVTQSLRSSLHAGVALVSDEGDPGASGQGIKPVGLFGASVSLRL